MDAMLKFTLPEEAEEFRMVTRAGAAFGVLWDLARQFRTWEKHGDRDSIPVSEIRQRFYEILGGHDLQDAM